MGTNKGAGEEVISHGSKRETYSEFVEKFKPKHTTDDCMTPPAVYEVVADWVANEYGLDRADFVRPFWPGGDYESFDYPEGCVVVDNPPFSKMRQIQLFLVAHGIKFFLFAPALTPLSKVGYDAGLCVVACGVNIIYDNGANVPTSFVTNLRVDGVVMYTAPYLFKKVSDVVSDLHSMTTPEMPRYAYPDNVVTAAMANQMCKYGVQYLVNKNEAAYTYALDSQKAVGKKIFGQGLLLSEKAAAEKAAAEKAAAEKAAAIEWQLSDRERAIIANLGKPKDKNDDE